MNEPVGKSLGVGTRPAQSTAFSRPTQPQPLERRPPILVILFYDHRRPLDSPSGDDSHQLFEAISTHRTGQLPSDCLLITRLFQYVLERVGCNTHPQVDVGVSTHDLTSSPAVLEGHIWSLLFETKPIPLFHVDLSLSLLDPQTSRILWQSDFPGEEDSPVWIGLGCRLEDMVSMALAELEAAALLHFRSAPFLEAVGFVDACPVPLPGHSGDSHTVMAASSWTSTDNGEVTTTAHESESAAPIKNDFSDNQHASLSLMSLANKWP